MNTSSTRSSTTTPPAASRASRPVGEVMHGRIVTCPPETSLRTVARMMSTYRIHSVVIYDEGRHDWHRPWAVVSDRDILRAVAAGEVDDATGATTAATEVVTTAPNEPRGQAARLLHDHEVAHLVVVDPASHRPVRILSTLDVASAVGGQL